MSPQFASPCGLLSFKHSALFFICVAAIIFPIGCAKNKPTQSEGALLLDESTSHTIRIPPIFVDDTSSLQYDVPVKNETGRPVRFTRIRQSCSCQGATKLAATELEPGQETTLHFDIDFHNRTGPQRFVCDLLEAAGAEWIYALETTLYERIRFADADYIHFGMVDPKTEEVRATQLHLHAKSLQTLPQNVSFRTDSDRLQVEQGVESIEELPDGVVVRKIPVKLRLLRPEAPGLEQATVYAEAERQGIKHQTKASVTWNVRSFYSVAPAQAYFGIVDRAAATQIERRIVIRRTDGQALSIKGIKVPYPSVRCSVEKTPEGSTGRLLLVLDPRSMSGPLWGEVTVETDHDGQPQLKIPVAALMKSSK
jgi:hypothetical protein